MRIKFFTTSALIVLGLLGFTACVGGFIPGTGQQNQPNLQATQDWLILQAAQATATQIALDSAQTVEAQPTSEPVVITVTPSSEVPIYTSTPWPTVTPEPSATQLPPTATVIVPTQTPVIVFVTPLPSATPQPCNMASFVADVTVPDGTVFSPGASFTKTWRLKNVSTCTWTAQYDLVFVDGNSLNGPAAIDMPGSVAPNQVIDVSVNMSAPTTPGTYRSNWKLRSDGGVLFGLNSGKSFYTEIRLKIPPRNIHMILPLPSALRPGAPAPAACHAPARTMTAVDSFYAWRLRSWKRTRWMMSRV